MKRVLVSIGSGLCLTVALFGLHVIVRRFLSWRDKPDMPNLFTYLLMPGYRTGKLLPVASPLQLTAAVAIDSLLFGFLIWVLLELLGIFPRVKSIS